MLALHQEFTYFLSIREYIMSCSHYVTGFLYHHVLDKVALGQVFSEYLSFPCQSSFHQILHPYNQSGQVH
jgi:hypothetical protein